MRIVGGRYRGHRLAAPADDRVRPTTDRVRESLFNILAHRSPPVLDGAIVLDLFAGTGALGLEALSRGAARAVFVDQDPRSLALVRANVAALKAEALCEIVRADAARLAPRPLAATLAFLDPPYGQSLIAPSLAAAADGGWLAEGAFVVIELPAAEEPALPPAFSPVDDRRYGATRIICTCYETREVP
ncbi:16S rRNA (guanine(966)-N(2))-methyltransferase RsmD [Emcibacter sp. SYSU 3D8]|uniref:16S rRNA (guanine(966)-N(2))-methyltransferase RsmD n=1 Tax=Emcibacter sp. SYSU 3D8 TaxID=3133969 RepID=UPI0031FE9842